MPSWGIRYLTEFQENHFMSENCCHSNYYSEMSGKGCPEVPPTSGWSACLGVAGATHGCGTMAKWLGKDRRHRRGQKFLLKSCSVSQAWRAGREPEQVWVEERSECGVCQCVCLCTCAREAGSSGQKSKSGAHLPGFDTLLVTLGGSFNLPFLQFPPGKNGDDDDDDDDGDDDDTSFTGWL